MGTFGAVIPITGLNFGFVGQVSRTGGGDPFIVAKFANANNVNNISFGDTVMLLPDSTGGTYRQFADWQTNGGGLAVTTNISNASATATPTSLAGLAPGMFVFGTGIPQGTFITAVNPIAGTITLSQNATATNASAALQYAYFAGIAVREVKTQLTYPITPGASLVGVYQPGQMTEVLVRGSITAKVNVGAPVANGPVYLRAKTNGAIPAGLLGDLEASPDGANNILLSNVPAIADAYFKTGVLDANNVSEITLLSRISA